MRPMHGEVVRIGQRDRCPCCQTKYSTRSAYRLKTGKRIARQQAKKNIHKELNDRV